MSNKKKTLLLITLFGLISWGTAIGFMRLNLDLTKDEHSYLRLFKEIKSVVMERYAEEVDSKKLIEGAVKGMIASLDPHSAYLPPEPYNEMKVEMSGSFGGLGIEINSREGRLTVIAPIEDTPAFRAGIKADDWITRIDATPTRGMTTGDAVKLMRGPKGTSVTLTITREGSPKPLTFPLVRDIIQTKSVKVKTLEPGYAYVRITHFQERTADDFMKALQTLREQNGGTLKGLVLDLRNNPGGLLDQAIKVANRFVGERIRDGLIVYTQGRGKAEKQEFNATIGRKEPHYPIVVLINIASASASEIVAGALQDHHRAVIMGTPSFGKGSIQSILPLRDGAALKLTTARYYTPSGRSIQARGIVPDIIVEPIALSNAQKKKEPEFHEKDLEKHLSILEKSGNDEVEKKDEKSSQVSLDADTAKDYQLVRALELLRGMVIMKNSLAVEGAAQQKERCGLLK